MTDVHNYIALDAERPADKAAVTVQLSMSLLNRRNQFFRASRQFLPVAYVDSSAASTFISLVNIHESHYINNWKHLNALGHTVCKCQASVELRTGMTMSMSSRLRRYTRHPLTRLMCRNTSTGRRSRAVWPGIDAARSPATGHRDWIARQLTERQCYVGGY